MSTTGDRGWKDTTVRDNPKSNPKRKPKKGNPTWPTGKPSLLAIEKKRRKENAAELPPGGVSQWRPWSLGSAARQGQVEMFPQEFPPAEPTVLRKRKRDGKLIEYKKPKPRRRMGVFS
jgi:hypothetical protein